MLVLQEIPFLNWYVGITNNSNVGITNNSNEMIVSLVLHVMELTQFS